MTCSWVVHEINKNNASTLMVCKQVGFFFVTARFRVHSADLQRRTVPFVGALSPHGAIARKNLRKAARKARYEFIVEKEMMLNSRRSRRAPLRKMLVDDV